MNKTTVGIIAAVAVTAVLGVTGVSMAIAQTVDYSTSTSSAPQLQKAHDDLAAAAKAGDVTGVRAAVAELAPVLAKVRKDVDRGLLRPEAATFLSKAEQQSAELDQRLAAPAPRDGILDSVTNLVSSLLDTVKNLISSLLGGASSSTTTKPPKP